MSSTLAAANPTSAKVSSAASSSRSAVSARRGRVRSGVASVVTMHDCIRYTPVSNGVQPASPWGAGRSAAQGGRHHGLRGLLHLCEVLRAAEGLGVDLVDV